MPSLAEAINKKYIANFEEDEDGTNNGEFVIYAPKCSLQQIVPHLLVVSSYEIDQGGDSKFLEKYLGNVVEIDISHNRLNSVEEIGNVLKHAPKLKFLNMSFNDVSSILPLNQIQFPIVDSLSTLILIGTKAPWSTVWFFLQHMKNVEELHLSLNDYDIVQLAESGPSRVFPKICKLMFDGNLVLSWQELSKFGQSFPNLQLLSLTNSPIQTIPDFAADNFKALTSLWISNCLISDQENVENLKYFSLLRDLRITGIPYMQDALEETRRQHIIALLPSIVTLNRGRDINDDERMNAERNFIRHYLENTNPPARYSELVAKHGEVSKFVDVQLKPAKSAKLLIRCEDKEVARVVVNLKQTVKEFKLLHAVHKNFFPHTLVILIIRIIKNFLEPIVGICVSKMDLYYLDIGMNHGGEIMKFPSKQLYTYQMRDNDEIHVVKK